MENNLLPGCQSVYSEHYSCETALVKFMDDIFWNMEGQELTALVVIDLSAAFDIVDHDVLLDILNNRFGFEENTVDWINSYLRPRKFKMNISQIYSEEIDVKFSVPQGSIFGPVLYSPYASTLSEMVNNANRTTNNDDQVCTNGDKPYKQNDVNINLHGFVDDML